MSKKSSKYNKLSTITVSPFLHWPTNDVHDLSALFQPFSAKPWSFWLDSCQNGLPDGQFDIMVWQPKVTLTTHEQQTTIHWCERDEQTRSTADPLALLQNIQAQVLTQYQLTSSALPFIGGAVGYFGYDLGRRFEQLPALAERDIDQPDMAVGIYTQALVFDKSTDTLYLVCPEQERQTIEQLLIAMLATQTENAAIPSATDIAPAFTLTSAWQSNIDQQAYGEKFNRVQNYLRSGDCYQINLAQRFSAGYRGDEYSAYLALRSSNNAPFSAFMKFADSAILSISPERFLQLKAGKVQSKPIKGTRARSSDKQLDITRAQELQQATKDRAENLMIVDLLRNDISKVCQPGSVLVPSLFAIESYPAVHHLVSTVEGIISPDATAGDLLRGAFPGGSITGAPKIRAMEIIEELEPQRRSVYCGAIGYLSFCGNMDTSITIRTLVCTAEKIYCWAGGGLVADSQVDAEYQETFDKVSRILPILSAGPIMATKQPEPAMTVSNKDDQG